MVYRLFYFILSVNTFSFITCCMLLSHFLCFNKSFRNNVLMCGIFVSQHFYVNKFYIPSVMVTSTIPICVAWSDNLMKKRVHIELHDYGDFGLTDVSDVISFLIFLLFS